MTDGKMADVSTFIQQAVVHTTQKQKQLMTRYVRYVQIEMTTNPIH